MARFSVALGEYEKQHLKEYIEKRNGMKENAGVNELVKLGLVKYNGSKQTEELNLVVREQIKFAMKPYTESLASLASKVTHMTGRTVFLLVQSLIDGMGNTKEERTLIKKLHIDAKALATSNMKVKSDDAQ